MDKKFFLIFFMVTINTPSKSSPAHAMTMSAQTTAANETRATDALAWKAQFDSVYTITKDDARSVAQRKTDSVALLKPHLTRSVDFAAFEANVNVGSGFYHGLLHLKESATLPEAEQLGKGCWTAADGTLHPNPARQWTVVGLHAPDSAFAAARICVEHLCGGEGVVAVCTFGLDIVRTETETVRVLPTRDDDRVMHMEAIVRSWAQHMRIRKAAFVFERDQEQFGSVWLHPSLTMSMAGVREFALNAVPEPVLAPPRPMRPNPDVGRKKRTVDLLRAVMGLPELCTCIFNIANANHRMGFQDLYNVFWARNAFTREGNSLFGLRHWQTTVTFLMAGRAEMGDDYWIPHPCEPKGGFMVQHLAVGVEPPPAFEELWEADCLRRKARNQLQLSDSESMNIRQRELRDEAEARLRVWEEVQPLVALDEAEAARVLVRALRHAKNQVTVQLWPRMRIDVMAAISARRGDLMRADADAPYRKSYYGVLGLKDGSPDEMDATYGRVEVLTEPLMRKSMNPKEFAGRAVATLRVGVINHACDHKTQLVARAGTGKPPMLSDGAQRACVESVAMLREGDILSATVFARAEVSNEDVDAYKKFKNSDGFNVIRNPGTWSMYGDGVVLSAFQFSENVLGVVVSDQLLLESLEPIVDATLFMICTAQKRVLSAMRFRVSALVVHGMLSVCYNRSSGTLLVADLSAIERRYVSVIRRPRDLMLRLVPESMTPSTAPSASQSALLSAVGDAATCVVESAMAYRGHRQYAAVERFVRGKVRTVEDAVACLKRYDVWTLRGADGFPARDGILDLFIDQLISKAVKTFVWERKGLDDVLQRLVSACLDSGLVDPNQEGDCIWRMLAAVLRQAPKDVLEECVALFGEFIDRHSDLVMTRALNGVNVDIDHIAALLRCTRKPLPEDALMLYVRHVASVCMLSVSTLIKHGASVSAVNPIDGMPIMHMILERRRAELTMQMGTLLNTAGYDWRGKGPDGLTPLATLVRKGSHNEAIYLVSVGVDPRTAGVQKLPERHDFVRNPNTSRAQGWYEAFPRSRHDGVVELVSDDEEPASSSSLSVKRCGGESRTPRQKRLRL